MAISSSSSLSKLTISTTFTSPSTPPTPKHPRYPPLTPRLDKFLLFSHYLLLPLLNLSLLIFAAILNHAYIYPTSLPLSLPFHLRGENIFKAFYILLCICALLIGAFNIYVLYTSITRIPAWRRLWRWWCSRPEMSWDLTVPSLELAIATFPSGTRVTGGKLKFGKPGKVPAWRMFAAMVFVAAGGWGFIAALGFRDMFRKKAWEDACGARDDGGSWELFAEIRVMNGGRGIEYDGRGAGTETAEREKWGTSSRVTFYTLPNAGSKEGGESKARELYRGRWKWDYEMDLVRRYDFPWGLGRYGYGNGDEDEVDPPLLVFALHDFLHTNIPSLRQNQTGIDIPNNPNNKPKQTHPPIGNQTNKDDQKQGRLFDLLHFNTTLLPNITTTTITTSPSSSSTLTTLPPTPSTLTDLKRPYLSTSDLLQTQNHIRNPFPIFKPPTHEENPYHSSYPPIQKILYFLGNSTWRATLTNTTASGFPALEETGGWNAGGRRGVGFIMGGGTGGGATGTQRDAKEETGGLKGSRGWSWRWEPVPKLEKVRWRWDGYFPSGNSARKNSGAGAFNGLCLPPRIRLRRRGRQEEVLKTVEVVAGGCGVVRVCGVAGARRKEGKWGGRGDEDSREGDVEWRSGGWKRSVEERWAVVVGLLPWEVERWGGCCAVGGL